MRPIHSILIPTTLAVAILAGAGCSVKSGPIAAMRGLTDILTPVNMTRPKSSI